MPKSRPKSRPMRREWRNMKELHNRDGCDGSAGEHRWTMKHCETPSRYMFGTLHDHYMIITWWLHDHYMIITVHVAHVFHLVIISYESYVMFHMKVSWPGVGNDLASASWQWQRNDNGAGTTSPFWLHDMSDMHILIHLVYSDYIMLYYVILLWNKGEGNTKPYETIGTQKM